MYILSKNEFISNLISYLLFWKHFSISLLLSATQEERFAYSETLRYRKKLFNDALIVLNPREKDILFKRRLAEKSATLDDLSKTYNISKERVRQIELNSIKKITKAVSMVQ